MKFFSNDEASNVPVNTPGVPQLVTFSFVYRPRHVGECEHAEAERKAIADAFKAACCSLEKSPLEFLRSTKGQVLLQQRDMPEEMATYDEGVTFNE
jgi:hypothetical protein